ncbi:Gmad2 immunoglobulin-like domain-containing protein [Henriciella litoralis]|uniref:Gmad2 immunoglobulin-like domain-containing protein n=1 Tax=Henriciella litoralis TaxID=568102 RepID=UPI00146EB2B9|nr:Gmad2 immunoglobulin-like domain-containing protein [Henriciella litoralis]
MTRTLILAASLVFAAGACSPNDPDEQVAQPGVDAGQEDGGSALDDDAMALTLDTPVEGADVTSPLTFSGSASGLWYFEGDFPVRLVDGSDTVIAESYASSQSNWMTEEQVPFKGEIEFDVSEATEATLILQADDPSGMKVPVEKKVALTLLPLKKGRLVIEADPPPWKPKQD